MALRRGGPVPPEELERSVVGLIASGKLAIPPYPAIALRVNEAAADPSLGLGEVARLVGADAALAADVLRCANSAFYSRGTAVTSLTHAVTRIGAQEVMRMALAASLSAHARAPGPLLPIRRMVWIENLAAAVLGQELARQRTGRGEEGFMLGLLHDFGKVVACTALEVAYANHHPPGTWPLQAWTDAVDRLHVTVGRLMAAQWKLPALLVDVIATHHDAAPANPANALLHAAIRAADAVVGLLGRTSGLRSEDLQAVPGLSPRERDALCRVAELVPELVASFEPPAAAGGRQPSGGAAPAIAPPETTLGSERRAVKLGVKVQLARRDREYTASAIGPDGLVLRGDEPLPESRLVQATLQVAEPLTVWTIVQLCRPAEGGGYTIELRAYALSAAERTAWDRVAGG